MHVSKKGNYKLGRRVYIINRPVKTTCPSSCPFLQPDSPSKCYAEFTERRFKKAKEAAHRNLNITAEQLYSMIESANKNNKDIRIHERGDFAIHDRLDTWYVGQWVKAIRKALKNRVLPKVWGYAHLFRKTIAKLNKFNNVHIYASVHNEADIQQAQQAGFSLFAYVLKVARKKGGSKDFPAYVNIPVLGRTLVCPEQRLGRTKITCDKCRWCIEGKGNVAFLESHQKKGLDRS